MKKLLKETFGDFMKASERLEFIQEADIGNS
jgi:hypothetical protein